MASWGRIAMRALKTLSGTPLPRHEGPEAASQTFKMGAPLTFVNGYLQECGTDPVLIFGLATKDGQSGATAGAKRQLVQLAHPDVLFLGYLDTSNSEGNGVGNATYRGRNFGIAKNSSTGKWYVDYYETTNIRVVIWDFWDQDVMVLGDTLPQVIFAFDPHYCQGLKTS
jgi:hypothetical protein